jgi:triosephosphate isomerase
MLAKLGCTYVTVGHSERRQYHGEDDVIVAAKARAAYDSGLVPIVCVGESESVREAQRHVEHVVESLTGCLADVLAEHVEEPDGHLVIAYEPVWAIGTGKTATAADAQEMCQALRRRLAELISPGAAARTRVLYGGSVKASNAAELLAQPDVDGALVGGASLIAEDFCGIVRGALPTGAGGPAGS